MTLKTNMHFSVNLFGSIPNSAAVTLPGDARELAVSIHGQSPTARH